MGSGEGERAAGVLLLVGAVEATGAAGPLLQQSGLPTQLLRRYSHSGVPAS